MMSPEQNRDEYYKGVIDSLKRDKESLERAIQHLQSDINSIECMIEQAQDEWEEETNKDKK